jgi:hypothetical protein
MMHYCVHVPRDEYTLTYLATLSERDPNHYSTTNETLMALTTVPSSAPSTRPPVNESSTGTIRCIVDSGTSIHILSVLSFLHNTREQHSAVGDFNGQTSRSTHSGLLTCCMLDNTSSFLTYHEVLPQNSLLVVPDTQHNLFSTRHATAMGYIILLDNDPGLYMCGDEETFIPFERCPTTRLLYVTLYPAPLTHIEVCPLAPRRQNTQDLLVTHQLTHPQDPLEDRDARLAEHHRLGHISP